MKSSDKILVLNVDRDNDLFHKAGVKGPVMGRESVLKAANELGLADPECSDFNAIFQAVKTYDEMKKQYNTEVAILTGDKNVGVKSDRVVGEQLDSVLKKFQANFVVLVTDGGEDEHVIPVIQSKVPILSVKRAVVKQADELQSIYFKVKDFLQETMEDPKISRMLFGVPAIILILYALFGLEGWRFMLGVIGTYLFLKGFKLDRYVLRAFGELESSLEKRKFAFFGYVVGMIFVLLASYRGYLGAAEAGLNPINIAAEFISHSIYLYFMGCTIAWVARNTSVKKRSIRKIAAIPLFGFAISLVAYTAADLLITPTAPGLNFILSIIVGFFFLLAAVILEWKG